uniref:Uncharacterized protein n=1 Tax=Candidatus Kentrum sp. TC TaxID=2126339 RepID=A0A450YIB5_9GAMM|nr:MAG: hypothetical protein BECKTC1821E_GA0114239_10116 [Candidatus Kentron sp. TC]
MKYLRPIFALILTLYCNHTISATSLEEISDFAKNICDEIAQEGEIKRSKIMGKLQGQASGVAKLLGAKVGLDGSIEIDHEKYKGLPIENLPEQLSDARICRKDLSALLLKERREIESILLSRTRRCRMQIIVPQEKQKIASSMAVRGISEDCDDAVQYRLVLIDRYNSHYSQGRLTISMSGEWSSLVYIDPSWSGSHLLLKVISSSDYSKWKDGVRELPIGSKVYDDVLVIVGEHVSTSRQD